MTMYYVLALATRIPQQQTSVLVVNFTAIGNFDCSSRGAAWCSEFLKLFQNLLALFDLSKDSVLSVQPWSILEANEELRSVGVWASIGHGEDRTLVRELEVLTTMQACKYTGN